VPQPDHRLILIRFVPGPCRLLARECGVCRVTRWLPAGLEIGRPAVRLMLHSCAGALDEATTYWLKNDRPFDPDAMVEVVVQLLITSLRCAAQLDPGLDVSDAVTRLL
jgi:hypothetical protein